MLIFVSVKWDFIANNENHVTFSTRPLLDWVIKMKPFEDAAEAAQYVERFEGNAFELKLAISHSLLDPIGINMAIITDAILKKGWERSGYEEKDGYRVYSYKDLA